MSDRTGGDDYMGSLLVEVKTVHKTWFAVFWKAGNQGNKWHQGNVDLSVRSRFLSWTIKGVCMGGGDGEQELYGGWEKKVQVMGYQGELS